MGEAKKGLMEAEEWLLNHNYDTPFVTSDTMDRISNEYSDDNNVNFYAAELAIKNVFDYWKYESDREEDYEYTE